MPVKGAKLAPHAVLVLGLPLVLNQSIHIIHITYGQSTSSLVRRGKTKIYTTRGKKVKSPLLHSGIISKETTYLPIVEISTQVFSHKVQATAITNLLFTPLHAV